MSQSAREGFSKRYEVPELYEISRGHREEWGISSYKPPKTTQYIDRLHKFPKEKRENPMAIAMKRSQEPDPAKYSPDLQTAYNRNWLCSQGKFLKGERITIIDQIMKNGKKFPGPGEYLKEDGKKKDLKGTFSKGDKIGFLSTVEALSAEKPSSYKYDPHEWKMKRNSNWSKSMGTIKKDKQKVGPGYYETAVKAKHFTMTSSQKYSFPKGNPPNAISVTAHITKNYPGVGKYPGADASNSLAHLLSKNEKKIIHPYKTKRYLEDIIKLAKTIPGPGTYEIGPPKPKKKN